jgi:hypothetical protein
MKVNIHIGWLIAGAFFLIALAYFFTDYFSEPSDTVKVKNKKDYDIVTFKLPNSIDADVFGPEYWKAYHKLTDMIPCSICRKDAVPMMRFVHDIVNKKLKKPIYDKENYDKWIARLCDKNEK